MPNERSALSAALSTIAFVSLLTSPAHADAPTLTTGVPIHITEAYGVARALEPVTFGVPLAEDDPVLVPASELVVAGPDGKLVPAQYRPLTRWGGGPDDGKKPIRFLLIDLQVDVPANASVDYTLRRKQSSDKPAKPPKLKWKSKSKGFDIKTGPGAFFISKRGMQLLDRLGLDMNGDGKVKKKEFVIDSPEEAGFFVEDRFGAEYASDVQDAHWSVEEAGPLRLVLRADGRHWPVQPGVGIGRDFFQYRTRLTFFAGKACVQVEHELRNAYLDDPLGTIGFEGYEFRTRLHAPNLGSLARTARVPGTLGAGLTVKGKVSVYQDSDGGPSWAQTPGTTLAGFEVRDGQDQLLGSGISSPGWITAENGKAAVTLAVRDFYANYPKGLEVGADGALTFQIFPSRFGTFHWLDDAQQKTTEFLLLAHKVEPSEGGDPAARVKGWQYPLRPWADAAWTRRTRAWGDLGDLDDPTTADATLRTYDDGRFQSLLNSALARSGFEFGWSEFGEPITSKNTHTTGSPRNRLSYFDKFAINGSLGSFLHSEVFARHSRDIRTFHIDGFTKEDHPNTRLWEGLPWSQSTDKLNRDHLDPALAPHRAGIPANGHGWNGFDIEHLVVDDLYEYYLLTGDPVCRDSLKEIGECMRTWPIYDPAKAAGSTRGVGWSLRALMKILAVTGDPRYRTAVDALVTSIDNTRGKSPSPVNGLTYHWITRFPPDDRHVADADFDLPWQLAVVIHGMLMHSRETGSAVSRQVAIDIADYIVDYSWNGASTCESLACDDHTNFHPHDANDGVNIWVPGALAAVYRVAPRPEYLIVASTMVNSVGNLTQWNNSNGWTVYFWWHSYKALIQGN